MDEYKNFDAINVDIDKFYREDMNIEDGETETTKITPEDEEEALKVIYENDEEKRNEDFIEAIDFLCDHRSQLADNEFMYHMKCYSTFRKFNEIIGLSFSKEEDEEESSEKSEIEVHLLDTVLRLFISLTQQSKDAIVEICKNGFLVRFMQNYQKYSEEHLIMAIVVIQNIFMEKTLMFSNIQFASIPISTKIVLKVFSEYESEEVREHCIKALANIVSIAPNKEEFSIIADFFLRAFHGEAAPVIKINALRGISHLLKQHLLESIKEVPETLLNAFRDIVLEFIQSEEAGIRYYCCIIGEQLVKIYSADEKSPKLKEFIGLINCNALKEGIEDETENLNLVAIKFVASFAYYNQEERLVSLGFVESLLNALERSFPIRSASVYLLCILYHSNHAILDALLEGGFNPDVLVDCLDSHYTNACLIALFDMCQNSELLDKMRATDIIDSVNEIQIDDETTTKWKQRLIDVLNDDDCDD